jgi:hypothetical protein
MPIFFALIISANCDAINQLKQSTSENLENSGEPFHQVQETKSKVLPASLVGFAFVTTFIAASFVVFAYINLNPSVTENELPEMVGKFKKDYSRISGSIFRTHNTFRADYKLASHIEKTKKDDSDSPYSTNKSKPVKNISYTLVDYLTESGADKAFKRREDCKYDENCL